MKGISKSSRGKRGLNAPIIYTKYLEFYADIVNNRNLEAKEFFKYIKKYGDNYSVNQKIEYLAYNISSIKADKLKLIMDYKKAILEADNTKIKKLQSSFDAITNVEFVNSSYEKNTNFYEIGKPEFNKEEVNNLINDFLNDKDIPENKLISLRIRIIRHLNVLDYKAVNDFNIKALNISEVSSNEIDEIIEVLNYFIVNIFNNIIKLDDLYFNYNILLSNIKKLDTEKNKKIKSKSNLEKIDSNDDNLLNLVNIKEKSIKDIANKINNYERELINYETLIRNFPPEIDNVDEKTKGSLARLYSLKKSKLKKYLKDYRIILEYISVFKIEIKNKENLANLKINLNSINLDENYIKDTIDKIRTIIKQYKNMSKYNLSDKKLEDMKQDYISKVYKPNN